MKTKKQFVKRGPGVGGMIPVELNSKRVASYLAPADQTAPTYFT
jgi:hypothetical protein